jgi:hypothetical protein
VNAYAIFAVNEHLEFLLDEAARNRAVNAGKPSLSARIAAAVRSLRMTTAATTYEMSSILPKLEDYPYRG